MDWKKILLKDTGKFLDALVKTQPRIVDLVESINTSTVMIVIPRLLSDITRTFFSKLPYIGRFFKKRTLCCFLKFSRSVLSQFFCEFRA